ncbi:MAG: hypothetical protein A3G34_04405 [Candidatus Lindowbacteria bacterium RIFCSPLOWO2_12_FULL_62_27]|nr:MAG: hypothetical protein A3G34_04405 [Candidatus Lindowbacteria bacterium RIFCSPLOWO2_12_FULL_62_27]
MSAKLVVLEGPLKGKTIPVYKSPMSIGRAVDADIVLTDLGVSRKHAQIVQDQAGYKLIDTQSRCGTILNQRPIRESPLNDGDEMVIGKFRIRFSVEAAASADEMADDETDSGLVSAIKVENVLLGAPHPETESAEHTHKTNLRLKALLEMATALQDAHDLDKVLAQILDRMFVILKPDRAYILLVDPKSGDIRPAGVKTKDGAAPALDQIPISHTICKRVIRSHEALITMDAATDQRLKAGVSIHDFSIRSAMCAPMIHNEKVVGLIHVDTKGLVKSFTNDDLELLVAAASTAATAVANTMLSVEIQRHEEVRHNMSRFFSPAIVEQVTKAEGKMKLDGERIRVSILFTDLRGFTALSQDLQVEDVVSLLNRHFSMAVTNLFKEGGTLDKFLGDGLMAIFGAPVPLKNPAEGAVKAATNIITATEILNGLIAADGLPPLKVGIGIATGFAIVGTIGSPERLEYTAIGSPVNLAARLTAVAEAGQILIDEATAEALSRKAPLKDLGQIAVKGFSGPIRHYQVTVTPAGSAAPRPQVPASPTPAGSAPPAPAGQ